MDSFISSSSFLSDLDENLALAWLAGRTGPIGSLEPTPWNTTSSGLASDYDLIRNSLTLDHQGDDDSEPPHQLASNESQPLKSVEQEIVELRNENAALKATNTALETENNTLRAAFNVLHRPTARPIIQSTGTLAAEASDVVVLLESADYLHIRFWYRSDWNKFRDTLKKLKASELEVTPKVSARGKARAAGGINMMMLYIKTEDGQSVSGHIASEICQTAQSIWKNMKDAGIVLPDKWGQIDDELKKDYLSKMAEAYPYIRLCHQNWKADYVATSFYSGWNNNKKNQGGNPEVGTSSGSQNKRSRKDSTTTMQKRLRPDVDPALSVVTSLDSEPGDAVKLDDFMPTASLPTYFAIPSAITGGPSINSQVPPEMYLGPDILKASILLRYKEVSEEKEYQG